MAATDIDETPRRDEMPRLLAQRLARAKADAVAAPGAFTCWLPTPWSRSGGASCRRPDDAEQARACLALLSGRRHRVLTGVVLVAPGGRRAERVVESVGRLRPPDRAADRRLCRWWRVAGQGGRLRDPGAGRRLHPVAVRQLHDVVGLPLFETAQLLRGLGYPAAVMMILAAASPGEVRVAAVDGRGLLDYALWRPGAPDGVGDLHRGRVIALMPAHGGRFVASAARTDSCPTAKAAAAGEGGAARRACHPRGAGRQGAAPDGQADDASGAGRQRSACLVASRPERGRTAGRAAPGRAGLVDDTALLPRSRPGLGARVSLVADAFDDEIEAMVEALGEPVVDLPGGARMSVHPTPALAAHRRGSGGRQCRARRASRRRSRRQPGAPAGDGAADPAAQPGRRDPGRSRPGCRRKRRAALGPAMAAALADDPLRPRFLGFSALGLAEILRPRVHPPLHELLAGPHAAGLAALRALPRESAAAPRVPLAPALPPPAVVAALRARSGGAARILRGAPVVP